MRLFTFISLVSLLPMAARAFVYSCEKLKYQQIYSDFEQSTRFVCLVALNSMDFGRGDQISFIRETFFLMTLLSPQFRCSFADIFNETCIERQSEDPWRIFAETVDLNCNWDLSLIFTSSIPNILLVEQPPPTTISNEEKIMVSPETGMMIRNQSCVGNGNISIYTGAGSGEEEHRYEMISWRCADFPEYVQTFDNVITLQADEFAKLTISYDRTSSSDNYQPRTLDRIAVMSSGRSDNLQNRGSSTNILYLLPYPPVFLTATCTGMFDWKYDSYVKLSTEMLGKFSEKYVFNGTTIFNGIAEQITVEYISAGILPDEIGDSQDNFVCELNLGALEKATTIPTPTQAPSIAADPYCGCALEKKFGTPDGWNSTDIWLDVIIILDTSEAMAEVALADASALIESFIGTDDFDVLITETSADFYTRVGLIAMSDKAEIIYNLNMTKSDSVLGKVEIKKGVNYINVLEKFDNRTLASFKQQGIIIVNNFLEPGDTDRPGLKDLASPGYYYPDIQYNYMSTIQLFCKANCFCRPDHGRAPYAGQSTDLAVQASEFTSAIPDSDYLWIGYSKSDAAWNWEDNSTNPYTNWDKDEPSENAVAKCAYMDATSLLWGAGNCNVGFPSVCEYAPCSVGNNNC